MFLYQSSSQKVQRFSDRGIAYVESYNHLIFNYITSNFRAAYALTLGNQKKKKFTFTITGKMKCLKKKWTFSWLGSWNCKTINLFNSWSHVPVIIDNVYILYSLFNVFNTFLFNCSYEMLSFSIGKIQLFFKALYYWEVRCCTVYTTLISIYVYI